MTMRNSVLVLREVLSVHRNLVAILPHGYGKLKFRAGDEQHASVSLLWSPASLGVSIPHDVVQIEPRVKVQRIIRTRGRGHRYR